MSYKPDAPKWIVPAATAVVLLGMTACGGNNEIDNSAATPTNTTEAEPYANLPEATEDTYDNTEGVFVMNCEDAVITGPRLIDLGFGNHAASYDLACGPQHALADLVCSGSEISLEINNYNLMPIHRTSEVCSDGWIKPEEDALLQQFLQSEVDNGTFDQFIGHLE